MTIPLSPEVLRNCTEGMLLKLMSSMFEIKHPGQDGKRGLAELIGKTPQHVGAAFQDRTSIGATAWLILEKHFGIPIYREWLKVRTESMNGQK